GETVADVDDRLPLLPQPDETLEQQIRIRLRQHGGRLVKRDHVAGMQKRARDLREAELRYAHRARPRARVERGAGARERLGHESLLLRRQPSTARHLPFEAEEDVA